MPDLSVISVKHGCALPTSTKVNLAKLLCVTVHYLDCGRPCPALLGTDLHTSCPLFQIPFFLFPHRLSGLCCLLAESEKLWWAEHVGDLQRVEIFGKRSLKTEE